MKADRAGQHCQCGILRGWFLARARDERPRSRVLVLTRTPLRSDAGQSRSRPRTPFSV